MKKILTVMTAILFITVINSIIYAQNPPRLFTQMTRSSTEVAYTGKDSLSNVGPNETFYLKLYVRNIPNIVGYDFKILFNSANFDSIVTSTTIDILGSYTVNINDEEVSPIYDATRAPIPYKSGLMGAPDTLWIAVTKGSDYAGFTIGDTYKFIGRLKFKTKSTFTTSMTREFSFANAVYSYNSGGYSGAPILLVTIDSTKTGKINFGVSKATITLTKTSLNFGTKTVGTKDSLTFYVKNTGTLALSVTSIGGLATPFSVTPTSITSVAISDSAMVKVYFQPAVSGAAIDTVVVASNDPANPTVTVIVQGTGQTGATLAVTPTTNNFGNKTVGTTDSVTVKIKNTGGQTLTGLGLSGLSAPFSNTSAPTSLNANDSTTVKVYFTPTVSGLKVDTLVVASTNGGTFNFIVQGTGQTRQAIAVKPTTLDFGSKNTGTQTSLTFKVTNNGDLALGVSSIAGLAAPFSVTPASITTVNKGDSVTVTVTFNPTSAGTFRDTVVIASNDPITSTLNVPLIGIGVVTGIIENQSGMPTSYALGQNYPNPFNPSTTIPFDVKTTGKVKITIYNALAQEVAVVVNSLYPAGRHKVTFNAQGLSSGYYFYKMEVNGFVSVKRALLIR